jgi:hypothetical protein
MTTGEILILSEKSLAQGDRWKPGATNLAPRDALCSPCGIQPINERQLRPLAALEPELQCEVWEEAVRSADGEGEGEGEPAGATTGG